MLQSYPPSWSVVTGRTRPMPMRTNATETERSGAHSRHPGCRYKIQIFDDGRHESRFQTFLNHTVRKSHAKTNISCAGYPCDVEVTRLQGLGHADIDAVIFRVMEGLIPRPMPKADMDPNQTWIFYTREAPRYLMYELGTPNLPVHATWTYSRASKVHYPYGLYKPGQPKANRKKSVEEWLEGKTKLVAWYASNCKVTFWPRLPFVTELKKHIPVDAYGRCGNLTCLPVGSRKCDVELLRQYKFYLAIENAECDDYITEKSWRKPLMEGVVPIVYGPRRRFYEELLPPNSFIFLGDFKNVKELADYIRMLDSKPELYVKYLEWQYKGSVEWYFQWDKPTRVCSVIPVIEKVKRGQLKRFMVGKSNYLATCRKKETFPNASFGVGSWVPWR